MASKTAVDRSDLIPVEVAAQLLELTPERIRQLKVAGYIEYPVRGKTTIVSAVRGYVRYLKEKANETTKTAAASRVTDARAAEIELRMAERKRELIPQDDALLAMDHLVGVVGKELRGLPAQITRDMVLRRQIEDKVHGAQERIAKALAQGKGIAQTGRDPSDTGTED